MKDQLLVAVFAEGMRDDLIDALIELRWLSGFSMQSIDGYSREHSLFDVQEQVAGYRRLCRVEIVHRAEDEQRLLDALSEVCRGSHLRYWIQPLKSAGHLP